ncbi:MAG: glycosyltransferase family 2 protein [Phascolarctobacterium sp.]|nr:glycosyltransferase family 2 protein [Phascolarctobacterium sp.]
MPKLSIIVPVYKVEQYIHKCVDSILNQTFTDFELILVDDGSPDNCGAICDEYALKDERVRVIHKENGGLSDARNFGLKDAKGEYVSFIDSDDWLDLDLYSDVLGYTDKNSLDVVCFDVYEVKGEKIKYNNRFNENKVFNGKDALYKILTDEIDNSACDKVYKRALWDGVEFPVGRCFEDVATIYKVFHKSKLVGYYKRAYYYYVKREGSIVATSFNAVKRYDYFVGYKDRYEYAQVHCKKAVEICKMFAVRAGLSTITADVAINGNLDKSRKEQLIKFLKHIGDIKHLNCKNKILLWGARNCQLINTIYGKLSMWSKKLK